MIYKQLTLRCMIVDCEAVLTIETKHVDKPVDMMMLDAGDWTYCLFPNGGFAKCPQHSNRYSFWIPSDEELTP